MNGHSSATTRRRRDDDDEESDERVDERSAPKAELSEEASHYDIYVIPSQITLSPTPAFTFSFIIVNRLAGLSTGLGIRYSLSPSPPHSTIRDPGFSILRHPEEQFDLNKAVLLGWIGEERVIEFDQVVGRVGIPNVGNANVGVGESAIGLREISQEWILEVARGLEMNGIVSNPELVLGGLWR